MISAFLFYSENSGPNMGVLDNVETRILNQTPEIPHSTSILYGFVSIWSTFMV